MTKIAIFSDSHDNIWNLAKALTAAQVAGAGVLLHCGDLCSPFIVRQLAEGFGGSIHLVFGNNDGDGRLIQTVANKYPHITHHGIYAELDLAGRKIAMIHYPEPALRIVQSGQFDLVCYGHDHKQHYERVGRSHFVNPGEIMGKDQAPAWGLYDAETHEFTSLTLD